jgi:hypothetical protein
MFKNEGVSKDMESSFKRHGKQFQGLEEQKYIKNK